MDSSFLTFLGVSIIVIVAPGPDTALTIRNTLRGGRPGGIGTALGVSIGQLIWAVATSAGLVAVLLASEPVFRAVRLAGAGYLIWLGLQSLRAAFRAHRPPQAGSTAGAQLSSRAAFVQGIVNNLGNPKMAVFFASVLPQFTAPAHGMHALSLENVFALTGDYPGAGDQPPVFDLDSVQLVRLIEERRRSGMLEFWIDPESPYAKPIFQEDKKFIFHCAGGLRSALAAKTAKDMGLKPVAHMGGGFAAWRDAGGPIEKWEPKKKG